MKLGAPAVVALATVLAAAALHPALGVITWAPWASGAVASLAVLAVVALVAGASAGSVSRWVALGAAVVLAAAAYDVLGGHQGRVLLVPGRGTRTFQEIGPSGQGVGARPLGFDLIVESLTPEGGAVLRTGNATRAVTPVRAASYGGVRIGSPRLLVTGDVARLHLKVSGSGTTREVDVFPGKPATLLDMTIMLEDFYPDFALDAKGQPFSRSAEPRNPAALFVVRRGGEAYRVFVIHALPGIHQIAGLGYSFALDTVESERAVGLSVTRQPGMPFVLAGLLLLALGLAVRP